MINRDFARQRARELRAGALRNEKRLRRGRRRRFLRELASVGFVALLIVFTMFGLEAFRLWR